MELLESLLLNKDNPIHSHRLSQRFLNLISLFKTIENASNTLNIEILSNTVIITALSLNTSNTSNTIDTINTTNDTNSDQSLK